VNEQEAVEQLRWILEGVFGDDSRTMTMMTEPARAVLAGRGGGHRPPRRHVELVVGPDHAGVGHGARPNAELRKALDEERRKRKGAAPSW